MQKWNVPLSTIKDSLTTKKSLKASTATKNTPTATLPGTTFVDALMTDESEHPCYAVWLTASQISNLVYTNGLIADPNFQRGKMVLRAGSQRQSAHSGQRSQKHIQSITNDLVTTVATTGRYKAIIPPIHLNLRTDEPGGLIYDEENMELKTRGRLYAIDGFHRILAIDQAVRVRAELDPNRLFLAYLYNAPSTYEAYVFCLLNDRPLRVPTTRTAWVSAPYDWNAKRLAYEFAHKTQNLVQYDRTVSPIEKLTNFETVRNGSPKNMSACYFNFRILVEGLDPRNASERGITNSPEFTEFMNDYAKAMTNPAEVELLATYMAQYWDKLCSIRPELGFMSIDDRKLMRASVPYLINKVTARSLIWLGMLALASYSPKKQGATFAERLTEVTTNQSARFAIFEPFEKLGGKIKDANGNLVDFFSAESPVWGTSPSGELAHFIKDRMPDRPVPLQKILSRIGGITPNSVKAKTQAAPGITPPARVSSPKTKVSKSITSRFKARSRG